MPNVKQLLECFIAVMESDADTGLCSSCATKHICEQVGDALEGLKD